MNYKKAPYGIILLLAATLFPMLVPISLRAAESKSCQECHKKYIDEELKKSFIHQPFLAKKCAYCHTNDWVNDTAESDGKAFLPKKIKQLGIDDNLALTHLFSIPRENELSVLFLEAVSSSSESFRAKLKVPPFEDLESLASDAKPPRIYDVQVVEVEKNSLASAKIRWHTDELSTSTINYGVGQPDGLLLQSNQYLSGHLVKLDSLKPDATYHFKIMSQDIYGNTRESQVFSFSTEKSYHIDEESHLESKQGPIKLTSEFFRSEDNYLVRISSNQHVRVEISTYDLPPSVLILKKHSNLPEKHPLLNSTYELNVVLCESCHQALSEKFSHPVHFRARLGSNVPADYPRLPDGQMSCLTCHEYHASTHPYHLRKSAERELCTGCHKRSFRNR